MINNNDAIASVREYCYRTSAYNCALPSIFALDLLEDGDVADGGKEENAGPNFDSIAAKNVVNRGFAVEYYLTNLHQAFP